jgi:hypothetical protein
MIWQDRGKSNMSKKLNATTIEKSTGQSWEKWLEFFKKMKADKLSHQEIADKVQAQGVSAWWSQNLAVAYEQEMGRRVVGQTCKGDFAVSIGKTLDGDMDDGLKWWLQLVKNCKEFSDVSIVKEPTTSSTDKWRYWRCHLDDGSRVTVNFTNKNAEKTTVSIQHEKLTSSDQIEYWRVYWKGLAN